MSYLALGAIENFTKGWAKIPFSGEKVHYWNHDGDEKTTKIFRSLCGVYAGTSKQVPPLNPGNFPKCKKCLSGEAKK